MSDRRRTITSPSYDPEMFDTGSDDSSVPPADAYVSDDGDESFDGGGSSDATGRGARDNRDPFADDPGEPTGSGPSGSGRDPQPEPETVSGSTTIDGVNLGGLAGGSDPSDAPGPDGGTETSTDRLDDPEFGPGPDTPGGRGAIDSGGDFPIAERIGAAEANPDIVDRATTGGFLSERDGSAGVLPSELGGVDISETRAREFARDAAAFGETLDLGAAFSSPADPLGSGGQVRSGRPIGAPDPENENPVENFLEGGARLGTDVAAAPTQAETVAEVAQSSPGIFGDFGLGEIGETSTAVGRDKTSQAAAAARENPAEFAGGLAAGLVVGGGLAGRSGGSLRGAVKAELDPRVGPFGTTAETRLFRGARGFLDDDRGQASLLGRQRGDGDSGDGSSVSDADLGPDIGPFDRSDARLYDPTREFGDDLGGMAPDDIDAPSSSNPSADDIGGGLSGRGDPAMAPGVEADSFSERGFGDVEGTRFDPNPTDTLGGGVSPVGAGVGGLLGVPGVDADATGAAAGGLLGAPSDLDATGATPDADTRGGVDLDTGFPPGVDSPTDTGTDTGTDAPTDTRTDQGGRELERVDVRTDVDAIDPRRDVSARSTQDFDAADPTDTTRRDPVNIDAPGRRDREFPFERDDEVERGGFEGAEVGIEDDVFTNPTRSLDAVDEDLTEDLDL